jgi:hypothetical protein
MIHNNPEINNLNIGNAISYYTKITPTIWGYFVLV